MKTVIKNQYDVNIEAADRICALLGRKNNAVLALCGGNSTKGLYKELVSRYNDNKLSLKNAKIYLVADYCGLNAEDERLCRNELISELVSKTDAAAENCFFIDESNFEHYDELIAENGGIDLCVLGIGTNAHIGFNEPATQYDTLSHRQKLTPKTRREKAALFGGEENVPEFGVTMGIKTIIQAKDIMVLAFGSEKQGPVFQMLYARDDSVIPAAFLQLPFNVTVYADEAAAALL